MTDFSSRRLRVLGTVTAFLLVSGLGVSAAEALPAAVPCAGAQATAGGAVPATFSDGGCFEGGRVTIVKPGYRTCRSKHGTWRFHECRKTYVWYYPTLQYLDGTKKPASCA